MLLAIVYSMADTLHEPLACIYKVDYDNPTQPQGVQMAVRVHITGCCINKVTQAGLNTITNDTCNPICCCEEALCLKLCTTDFITHEEPEWPISGARHKHIVHIVYSILQLPELYTDVTAM